MTSKEYIQKKLKDHQEYISLDENKRKKLITCNLYHLENAFEDGENEMLKKICKWLSLNMTDTVYIGCHGCETLVKSDLIKKLKKQCQNYSAQMKEINFEYTWCDYLTPCPYRKDIEVGSYKEQNYDKSYI